MVGDIFRSYTLWELPVSVILVVIIMTILVEILISCLWMSFPFKQSTFLKMTNLLGQNYTIKYNKFLGIYTFVNNIISKLYIGQKSR